ncbi:SEFIR domain-containing protein [Acrocarpospora catenulata]|uniref:SEFIR domain-containing protein n=1 Tax=Acrocarpospora catenulata TaxID=2836182 RepID=UPI001BD96F39|nr:SEFIR domain-containing protein [Acrocarpospora catenulata]
MTNGNVPENEMRIELTFTDQGGRWVDSVPEGISLGALTLHGWEVHPVSALPDVSGGMDCYLIKVNYELELAADSAPLTWYEAGFAFTTDSGKPVTMVDALPRSTSDRADEGLYTLTDWLHLVPYTAGGGIQLVLPQMWDVVHAFGIGGPQVRWRHLARPGEGVGAGSGVAWIVALVPKGSPEVLVEFSVRYALNIDDMIDAIPTQGTKQFPLKLREGIVDRLVIEPVTVGEEPRPSIKGGPRVFMCYAHDDGERVRQAFQFGELLVRLGVDLHMDKTSEGPRQDWFDWAIQQIRKADFIVIIASPKCRAAGDAEIDDQSHPGIRTELAMIKSKLHEDRKLWTSKLLPVVLPGENVSNIPLFLSPSCADYYVIDEVAEEALESLLRAMGRTESGEWPRTQSAGDEFS